MQMLLTSAGGNVSALFYCSSANIDRPPPKIHVHSEPQNVSLFRNKVFADVLVKDLKIKSSWTQGGP